MYKKFEYVEMFSSSICNLNCTYCYIPKVSDLKELNKKLIQSLDDGTYIKRIKYISKDLKGLSFWGAEPTLTLPKITKHLDELLREFPQLNRMGFSSNFTTNPEVIFSFLNKIPNNRKMDVDIQISLDGHEDINDSNRGIGTTKIILNNIRLLAFLINDIKNEKLTISLHTKTTWTADNIRYFLENVDELNNSYNFFMKLQCDLNRINTNKNAVYQINSWGNMEVPGNYTKEDGLMFAEMLKISYQQKRIYNSKTKKFIEKKWEQLPLCFYLDCLKKTMFYFGDIYSKAKMFTCSAGDSQYCVAHDGYHVCHRTYNFSLDQVREYENCDVDFVYDHMVVKYEDFDNEYSKKQYTIGSFHNFLKMRQNAAILNIYEAAEIGEILPKYKKYEEAYYLALICTVANSCHQDNLIMNYNMGIIPLSLIRLFGNGGMDILLEEISKEVKMWEAR